MITSAVLGAIGGLTRSCIGLMKSIKNKQPWKWHYWVITSITSMIIGIFAGLFFNNHLALLAGYAGTDFVENMYKLL